MTSDKSSEGKVTQILVLVQREVWKHCTVAKPISNRGIFESAIISTAPHFVVNVLATVLSSPVKKKSSLILCCSWCLQTWFLPPNRTKTRGLLKFNDIKAVTFIYIDLSICVYMKDNLFYLKPQNITYRYEIRNKHFLHQRTEFFFLYFVAITTSQI